MLYFVIQREQSSTGIHLVGYCAPSARLFASLPPFVFLKIRNDALAFYPSAGVTPFPKPHQPETQSEQFGLDIYENPAETLWN